MNAGYPSLREKVRAFLLARGGAVDEDTLIGHVFGSAGSPLLWRSLLKQLLAAPEGEATFEQLADGSWQLAGARPKPIGDQSLAALDYVVFDVETTGLKPYSQRIIEIAAIRFRGGREDEVFSTLVQPDRALPAQIVSLTRITDDLLADAPRFDAIAAPLRAFLGDDLIIGHNISFDLAFLDAELRRAGHPSSLNARLDTLALAQRVLSGQRRWNLDAVARALGVHVAGNRHRAEADTRLTAAVFAKLLTRAPERGLHGLDDLLRVGGARGSAYTGEQGPIAVGRGRAVMNPAWLDEIPHLPGCYLMRDARDTIIYVGKAKDLRNRVGSYYSQTLGETKKPGLLEAIARIETIIVGSELEALLLESQLIRRYTPRYNVQGRRYEHYPYIKVDLADAWPRVRRTRRKLDDGAAYFGPFRNPRAVRRAVETITEILPIRTCRPRARTPEARWPSCMRLTLGQCLGPCVGKTTRAEYGALIDDLVRFLSGDAQVMIDRVQAQRVALQSRGFSTKAAGLEAAQRHLATIARDGALIATAARTDDLILVLPAVEASALEVLLLTRGRLWARFSVSRADDPTEFATKLRRSWSRAHAETLPPTDHETIDETALLGGWLRRRGTDLTTFALPQDDREDGWRALAGAILRAEPRRDDWEPEISEGQDEDAAEDDEAAWEEEEADELIVLG